MAAVQLRRYRRGGGSVTGAQSRLLAGGSDLSFFGDELDRLRAGLRQRVNADGESLEQGLAQLVLTVIELLRQLMERQALHRMQAGTLSDEEVERLGRVFMALSERMDELKDLFGLEDEDLNLNLGPLGNLM
jgi:hypothetical protein